MAETMNFSTVAATQTELQFDIRNSFNSFQRPKFLDILNSVKNAYPGDGGIIVTEGTRDQLGIYTVFSSSQPVESFIKLSRKISETNYETVNIPLTPPIQRGERSRDGLLITIVEADLGENHAIPGREFDAALEAFGHIEVYTESQKYKGSSIFNGNRYCVIKKNPDTELPNRLEVRNKSFLIKYKNKKWMCSSCKEEHTGACPYRKRLFEARDKRKTIPITHHIVSDSSLRLAEQSGLCADISCMSGATVGQLVNAVSDDDEKKEQKNIIFVGGANDTKVHQTENDRDIVKKIDTSLNRMIEICNKNEDKNFYLMNSMPHITNPSRRQCFARTYFNERVNKLCTMTENIDIIKPPEDPNGWGDDFHPTRAHTESLILSITKEVNSDIIIDPGVLSTEKFYRGVEGHYLSGCTGCSALGRFFDGGFCSECVQKMSSAKKLDDDKLFKKIIRNLLEKYPQAQKRHLSDDDDNDGADSAKKSN